MLRNNLMHGSKFIDQGTLDPQRETRLLAAAMAAVEIIVAHLPDTQRAFNSPAH